MQFRSSALVLVVLPLLATAVDFQITMWTCSIGLDGGETYEETSVRNLGDTGCSGCTLTEEEGGNLAGGNPAADCSQRFSINGNGFAITGDTIEDARVGTCVEVPGDNDVCSQWNYSCSIVVTKDCTIS